MLTEQLGSATERFRQETDLIKKKLSETTDMLQSIDRRYTLDLSELRRSLKAETGLLEELETVQVEKNKLQARVEKLVAEKIQTENGKLRLAERLKQAEEESLKRETEWQNKLIQETREKQLAESERVVLQKRLDGQKVEMQEKLAKVETERATFEKHLHDQLEAEKIETQKQLVNLAKEIKQKEQSQRDLCSLQKCLDETLQNSEVELQKYLVNITQEKREKEKAQMVLSSLQIRLDKTIQNSEVELQKQLTNLEQEKREKEQMKMDLSSFQKRLEEALQNRASLDQQTSDKHQLQNQISELEKRLDEELQNGKRIQEKQGQLQTSREDKRKAETQSLVCERDAQRQLIADLNDTVSTLKSECESSIVMNTNLTQRIEYLTRELSAIQQPKACPPECATREHQIQELTQELVAIKAEHKRCKTNLGANKPITQISSQPNSSVNVATEKRVIERDADDKESQLVRAEALALKEKLKTQMDLHTKEIVALKEQLQHIPGQLGAKLRSFFQQHEQKLVALKDSFDNVVLAKGKALVEEYEMKTSQVSHHKYEAEQKRQHRWTTYREECDSGYKRFLSEQPKKKWTSSSKSAQQLTAEWERTIQWNDIQSLYKDDDTLLTNEIQKYHTELWQLDRKRAVDLDFINTKSFEAYSTAEIKTIIDDLRTQRVTLLLSLPAQ